MTNSAKYSACLERFSCLGDGCEDTCCRGWGMQLDTATKDKYEKEAPELLEAVTSGEAELIMRRDPKSDYCVKYDNGWCGIHKKYGTDFLGDACNFYPRVTRALGDEVVMTATLSCPEIARLVLLGDNAHQLQNTTVERLPHSMKDYLPPQLSAAQALKIHQAFLTASADEGTAAEQIMLRIISVCISLEHLDKTSWEAATEFYLQQADSRLPVAEKQPTDPYNLLHAFSGLIAAAPKPKREYLAEITARMELAIGAKLNWQELKIATDESSYPTYLQSVKTWHEYGRDNCAAILRRWISAQIALALFPFSGFGNSLTQRAILMGVRFAIVKLALISLYAEKKQTVTNDDIIKTLYRLARFLDHLADPTMMIKICEETGWLREPRLRGLIES